jgi:hypothetical protein
MRLAKKTAAFCVTYVIGGLLLGGLALATSSEGVVVPILLLWFVGFAIAQFVILRCPHCKKLAIRTPRGAYVPWAGSRCRYCGEEY